MAAASPGASSRAARAGMDQKTGIRSETEHLLFSGIERRTEVVAPSHGVERSSRIPPDFFLSTDFLQKERIALVSGSEVFYNKMNYACPRGGQRRERVPMDTVIQRLARLEADGNQIYLKRDDLLPFSITDVAVAAIGYVCDRMGLAGFSQSVAFLATDKTAMKEAFRRGPVVSAAETTGELERIVRLVYRAVEVDGVLLEELWQR